MQFIYIYIYILQKTFRDNSKIYAYRKYITTDSYVRAIFALV